METGPGQEDDTLEKTAKLTYYHSDKDAKKPDGEGVEIPLVETMGVKTGHGKTKGAEPNTLTLNPNPNPNPRPDPNLHHHPGPHQARPNPNHNPDPGAHQARPRARSTGSRSTSPSASAREIGGDVRR